MTTNNEATTGGRDDEQAIRRLTEDWLAAVKTKDTTRLEQMVTEDAVFLPPAIPSSRETGVESLYNSFFPQFGSVEQTAFTLANTGGWRLGIRPGSEKFA